MPIKEEILQKLSAYLDGELPDDEAAGVGGLIESDPAVKEEYRKLHTTRMLLKSLPAESLGNDFTLRVAKKVAAGWKKRSISMPARLAAVAAAVLVVAGLGYFVAHRHFETNSGAEVASKDSMNLHRRPAEAAIGKKGEKSGESVGENQLVMYCSDVDRAAGETRQLLMANAVKIEHLQPALKNEALNVKSEKQGKIAGGEEICFRVRGTQAQLDRIRRDLNSRSLADAGLSQIPEDAYNSLITSMAGEETEVVPEDKTTTLAAAAEKKKGTGFAIREDTRAMKTESAKSAPAPTGQCLEVRSRKVPVSPDTSVSRSETPGDKYAEEKTASMIIRLRYRAPVTLNASQKTRLRKLEESMLQEGMESQQPITNEAAE